MTNFWSHAAIAGYKSLAERSLTIAKVNLEDAVDHARELLSEEEDSLREILNDLEALLEKIRG